VVPWTIIAENSPKKAMSRTSGYFMEFGVFLAPLLGIAIIDPNLALPGHSMENGNSFGKTSRN